MDFKKTLNLPNTKFKMKANLVEKEKYILNFWKNNNIFDIFKKSTTKKFIIHDGPIYSNGDIHVGHILNRFLKDIVRKYKQINKYDVNFISGWDNHGLPIELKVLDKFKFNYNNVDPLILRKKSFSYAKSQVQKQLKQFNKLGLMIDEEKIYLTLNKNYIIKELEVLLKLFEQNLIYRQKKPVYWSIYTKTSLSESEIIYKEKESNSIIVSFDLSIDKNPKKFKDYSLLVWTTTPWTLPSNQLIAIDESKKYLLIKYKNKKYICLKSIIKNIFNEDQLKSLTVVEEVYGKELVGLSYRHCLYNKQISTIVNASFIDENEGTGIVHIASGFGIDDYNLVLKNKLNIFCPIEEDGRFNSLFHDSDLKNKLYFEADEKILKKLKDNKKLFSHSKIIHSFPHDWRLKKPVIYRASWQWFINLKESDKNNIIKNINQISWSFEWQKKLMIKMIKNRSDWCISRQRSWGVPIPIFFDSKKQPILNIDLIKNTIFLLSKYGVNSWWEDDLKEFKKKYFDTFKKNIDFDLYSKNFNILDVWFDSGVSHYAVLSDKNNNFLSSDLIIEGDDQFRGWFNSTLFLSYFSSKTSIPFKKILIHGFVLDENGKKMSKSIGNVVDPIKISSSYGIEILRLWIWSVNYTEDVKIGKYIIEQICKKYIKIRNTIRYLLANLSDFNYEVDFCIDDISKLDKYMLLKTEELYNNVNDLFKEYNFNFAYTKVNNFIIHYCSNFYFDIIKDSLYVEYKNSSKRRKIQSVLYYILNVLLKLLFPILPFTVEEAYQNFNQSNKKFKSILLSDFLVIEGVKEKLKNENKKLIFSNWEKIITFKKDCQKFLEFIRKNENVNNTYQLHMLLCLNNDYSFIFDFLKDELSTFLLVSKISIVEKNKINNTFKKYNSASFSYIKNWGLKCLRCWKHFEEININNICNICQKTLKKIENSK